MSLYIYYLLFIIFIKKKFIYKKKIVYRQLVLYYNLQLSLLPKFYVPSKLHYLNNFNTVRSYNTRSSYLKKLNLLFFKLCRLNRASAYNYFFNNFKKIFNISYNQLSRNSKLINNYINKKNYSISYFLFFYKGSTSNNYSNLNYILLYYNFMFKNYMKTITNILFNFKFCDTSKLVSLLELNLAISIIQKITPPKFKLVHKEEIAEIILVTFITKNILFLVKWLKKILENRPLTMFKAIVHYIYYIICLLIWKKKSIYNIKGFFFKYRGKFIKGGGKKKKITYTQGSTSSTKKSLKIIYKKFYIRTISGIIGCTFKISF